MSDPVSKIDLPESLAANRAKVEIGAGPDLAARKCLMCGSLGQRPVFREFGIDILRCQNCRHVFSSFHADPHFKGFWGDEVAEDKLFYWSKARARMHGDFVKRFLAGRSGRLLDMGSGLGFFVRTLERDTTWDVYGCEISPTGVAFAREKLGLRKVICSRLDQADFPRASFDMITMWDVIDHILAPDPVLSHCHELLKKGGILFLRTPNIDIQLPRARMKRLLQGGIREGSVYLQASDHPHQYSMQSIRKLLERNGFVSVEFVHLHPIEAATEHNRALIRGIKNMCFGILRGLAFVSGGRWNLDNLFVVARKKE